MNVVCNEWYFNSLFLFAYCIGLSHNIVVLNQISLVCKVYYKYRKQPLLQKYLDYQINAFKLNCELIIRG